MTKLFTFRWFTRSIYFSTANQKSEALLKKAPGEKVRFIKDFARSYEAVPLTICDEKDLILN